MRYLFMMIIFAMVVETMMFVFIDAMGGDLMVSIGPKPTDKFTSTSPLQNLAILGHLLTSIFLVAGFIGFFTQITKPESTYTGQTYTQSFTRRY